MYAPVAFDAFSACVLLLPCIDWSIFLLADFDMTINLSSFVQELRHESGMNLILSSHVQTLILRDCERITDMGMRALCKGPAASSLVHLNVNGCERLTDAAALRMAACLHHLNTLSLEHCRHMTCRSASAISERRSQPLPVRSQTA